MPAIPGDQAFISGKIRINRLLYSVGKIILWVVTLQAYWFWRQIRSMEALIVQYTKQHVKTKIEY